MALVLDVKNLSVTYKNKSKSVYAVREASFSIDQGDSMGIVGESGSGKSTMAMALLRLLPAKKTMTEGEALFLGQDLLHLSDEELNKLRWKNVSVVFQKAMNSLSPVHRIGDQIEDIYRIHEPEATRRQAHEQATKMLSLVNLNERVYRLYPHELSGGMLQRVMIAVSLLHEPDLLIMDEATTALDVVTQGQILSELRKMESELKTSRIIITHDISVVSSSCNKIAVMYAGSLLESGLVSDVLTKPAHPYTKGLLSAFPPLRSKRAVLESIPGFLPDMAVKHEGCIFAPRCPEAVERCGTAVPARVDLGNGHYAACHLVEGEKQ